MDVNPEVATVLAHSVEEFQSRVRAVGKDAWDRPTPCSEWDVRALVNHVTVEQLWVPPLVGGSSVADVGAQVEERGVREAGRLEVDRKAVFGRQPFLQHVELQGADVDKTGADATAVHRLYLKSLVEGFLADDAPGDQALAQTLAAVRRHAPSSDGDVFAKIDVLDRFQ